MPVGALVLLALAAQTTSATTTASTIQARFTSGAEWDTNAQRAVNEGQTPLPAFQNLRVEGDGLARITADISGQIVPSRRLAAWLGYQLGAKRFVRERSQDFFTHQFFAQGAWFVSDAATLGASGSFRLSRIRSGLRDYNIGSGSAYARWTIVDGLSIGATGVFTGFRYLFDDHFDYRGPSFGGDVLFTPTERVRIFAGGVHHWRDYARNGLVPTVVAGGNPIPTFCDELYAPSGTISCTPTPREDTEVDVFVGARYTGPFQVGGQYRLRVQRSNSPYENTDRHRLTFDVTFSIVDDLTATAIATLQLNNQTAITDTLQQAEDDENRNSASLGLRYAATDNIAVDLRYAVYVEQFSTNTASYLRQLFYLGLGYRTDVFDLP